MAKAAKINAWPKGIPEPDVGVLSDDQFRELLVQYVKDLGEEGITNWILLLSYSVRVYYNHAHHVETECT